MVLRGPNFQAASREIIARFHRIDRDQFTSPQGIYMASTNTLERF
jgi:hypothetical protein